MRTIGGILLAAGGSTRLGRPKQLVRLGTENLLERSVRVAQEATLSPILVVMGRDAEEIAEGSNLRGVQVVLNAGWQEGMASSIRSGIRALPAVDGVVIMACDMPAVTADHLRLLTDSGRMTGTSYAGRRGIPAYLPWSMFPALELLTGDKGARDLLENAESIALPGGELDIDTELELQRARRLFG